LTGKVSIVTSPEFGIRIGTIIVYWPLIRISTVRRERTLEKEREEREGREREEQERSEEGRLRVIKYIKAAAPKKHKEDIKLLRATAADLATYEERMEKYDQIIQFGKVLIASDKDCRKRWERIERRKRDLASLLGSPALALPRGKS
jgi:hypothetical protein